ncbi:2-oxoacid:acceptor oxidoreductase subunit alpha [Candidatus Micrarchaeota archaeon]|nr:2-oxoacid:acceptor oxidoreductase subunit alpha [Candidatus Micrarchaeota archaeon]
MFICKIAAQAGAGVMTTGRLMVKCFTRGGYHAIGYPEYPSLIRGGHNVVQVRISDRPIHSPVYGQDLVIALNKDAIFYHMNSMHPGGAIIYDQLIDAGKFKQRPDVKLHPLPLSKLTQEAGGTEQMKNTAALGAALAIIDYPFEVLEQIMRDEFKHKGEEVIKKNINAAKAGYDHIKANKIELAIEESDGKGGKTIKVKKIKPLSNERRVIITGNEAIALGSIKAGVKFYAAYPMTPASTILHYMIENEKIFGVVAKQTEDEIAAINYAIGAAYTGARAMTGTSGGGFALMAEALGMAAIAETPIVIALAQRIGPSTGMPTWTEQGDLRFALHASQGDFLRIVLAPGDVQECFFLAAKAHNLAEKYQLPVLILSDKNLSESVYSTDKFDQSKVKIERGKLLKRDSPLPQLPPMTRWKRYTITEDGVSDRSVPGMANGIHVATSYEHDETGFSSESFHMRVKQVDKRARKIKTILKEMDLPKIYGHAPKDAEIVLVGWGSMKLSVLDALPLLEASGIKTSFIHFNHIYPLDEEKIKKMLEFNGAKKPKIIMLENNSSAQFAGVLRQYTGIQMDVHLLKYDGRPFFPEQVLEEIQKLKANGYKTPNGERDVTVMEKEDLEYYNTQRHGL